MGKGDGGSVKTRVWVITILRRSNARQGDHKNREKTNNRRKKERVSRELNFALQIKYYERKGDS